MMQAYPNELIYSYTAQQAVADGVLEEINALVSLEAGFRFPVRVTPGVKQLARSPEILEDVLLVARLAILHASKDEWLVEFEVLLNGKFEKLWAALDTTSGPAIHLMRPEEY